MLSQRDFDTGWSAPGGPRGQAGGYVTRLSRRGHPYLLWERPGVPRIADDVLDCAIYLYPSVAAAEAGEAAGGSGFLVSVPSATLPDTHYAYAITNGHVVDPLRGNSPVISLNTQAGERDILHVDADHWIAHPNGDDIAALFVGLSAVQYRFQCVPAARFISTDAIDRHDVGVGDEVFMVGRFITHEGRQRNWPSLRFGNIAMMNHEPVHFQGRDQEAFLVEARSLSGFSGAPVFVHIPPLTVRPRSGGEIESLEYRWWLLGLDCGHLRRWSPVVDTGGKPVDDYRVESNTGMMVVVPAWKIAELLNAPELASRRGKLDQRHGAPGPMSAVEDASAD